MCGKLDICQEWAFVIVICVYLIELYYQYVVKVVNIHHHSDLVFASCCPGHLEEAAKSARLTTKHELDEVLMKREVMCLAIEIYWDHPIIWVHFVHCETLSWCCQVATCCQLFSTLGISWLFPGHVSILCIGAHPDARTGGHIDMA